MERDFGVAGRLLGLGVLDNLLPLIWETQPDRFPLTGTILDLAEGLDRPLRATSSEGARRAGYARAALADPAPGLAATSRVEPAPLSAATRSSAASGT